MLHILGYAGLIPFVVLPVVSLVWPLVAPAQALLVFQFYSCLILGFMAGAIWPVLYQPPAEATRAIWAVSFPVLAIIVIALLPAYSLVALAGLFVALRLYEYFTELNQHYSRAYRQLRNQLTTVVVICHLAFYIGYAYVG